MPERAVWQPPRGLCAHDGSRLPLDLEFFVAPPDEIGPVTSAYSTLKKGKPAGTLLLRGSILFGGLFFGFCGGMMTNKTDGITTGVVIFTALGGLLGAILACFGPANHQCQFVGEDGVAYFDWTMSGPSPAGPGRVLEFRDATTIRTFLFEMIQNGISQGIQYTYTWERESPLPPFKYLGNVRSLNSIPSNDRYHFALAAERAWTTYKMPILQEEFRTKGTVTFPLRPRGFVRLSREEIEIDDKKGEKAFSLEKVESIRIKHGKLVFRRVGAKPGIFTSGKGIYTIPYEDLGDGQLFLIVVHALLEHAWGEA